MKVYKIFKKILTNKNSDAESGRDNDLKQILN